MMNLKESRAPLLTIYTTVYNSKDTIEKSLESIIKALDSFDWEAVVVDNFSTDGTYELLLEYSKKIALRVYKYRCSRGLGRCIASRLSKGEYLIYADLDCVYNSRLLKRVILGYLRSRYRDTKCIVIGGWMGICPKHILESYTFRDLNIAEDIDLATRLYKNDLIIMLPPLKHPIKEEIRDVSNSRGVSRYLLHILSKMYITERRYEKSFIDYIKRDIRNQLDRVTGSAITLPKFIREELYRFRANHLTILYRTLLIMLPMILRKLLKKQVFEADPLLSNNLYLTYKVIKEAANRHEIGLSENDFTVPNFDRTIQYIARFYPDIIDAIKKCKQ